MSDDFSLTNVRQWRTFEPSVIKESPHFTEVIQKLMSDELYAELQQTIIEQPNVGDLIPGGGGLRKVRWRRPGAGKRGGIRVIYYWINKKNEIYMLHAYAKNRSEDITHRQIKLLRKMVEED